MLQQAKAKIFLADAREVFENDFSRNTRSRFSNQVETSRAQGLLTACDDEVLAPDNAHEYVLALDTTVLLLPIVGSLHCKFDSQEPTVLQPGECIIKSLKAGRSFQVYNSHPELINYLQLRINHNGLIQHNALISFESDLERNNGLSTLVECDYKISIGCFNGRQECEYKLAEAGNKVFCFVIQGAFEVAYRLLHARDGLCLWETESFEVEALSNNAIVLFVEGPKNLLV